jgi:hypothetical protein
LGHQRHGGRPKAGSPSTPPHTGQDPRERWAHFGHRPTGTPGRTGGAVLVPVTAETISDHHIGSYSCITTPRRSTALRAGRRIRFGHSTARLAERRAVRSSFFAALRGSSAARQAAPRPAISASRDRWRRSHSRQARTALRRGWRLGWRPALVDRQPRRSRKEPRDDRFPLHARIVDRHHRQHR